MILPVVSVIIPFYKRIDYLKETLASVIAQTYSHWELILVNDDEFDNDQVRNHISTISDNGRIRLINRGRHPKGASTCRNLGTQTSTGTYIIFLDSDDLLAPYCLEQRGQVIQTNPDLDFAVFPMEQFEHTPGDLKKLWNIENDQKHLDRFLRLDAVWQTSGPIWKKEALLKIGGFDEGLACWQDIDIHLKALLAGLNYRLFYDCRPDCYYRRHQAGSISQSNINSMEKLISRRKLYFMAVNQPGIEIEKAKPMALSIIYSAIITLRYRYAFSFIKKCRQQFSGFQYLGFVVSAFVYFSRLYKVPGIRTFVHRNLFNTGSEIHIGKHASE